MERAMNKIVIVYQETRLQELVERFNTKEQAKFYIEHLGTDFADYVDEDRQYLASLMQVRTISEKYARVSLIEKSFVYQYLFGEEDVVVCVGRDGLVCNTIKYLNDTNLVIGINPDPARWDGVVLPFDVKEFMNILPMIFSDTTDKVNTKAITFAHAVNQSGQEMYAANDLFIGPASHISARYNISYRGMTETQSSSGVIISTGLGQSGWFKSVMAQIYGGMRFLGTEEVKYHPIAWDSGELTLVVREPYPSVNSYANITMGLLGRGDKLTLRSNMPEKGVIFSDGIEDDYIEFNSGSLVTVSVAKKEGHLVLA